MPRRHEPPLLSHPLLAAVTPYGPTAGSSRVRVYEWLERVAPSAPVYGHFAGNRASAAELLTRYPTRCRRRAELRGLLEAGSPLLLHREASPLSIGALERRLIARAKHAAFDLDDALFADKRMARRQRVRTAAANASVVIAGNDYIANWASAHSRDVRVIPSCVDEESYAKKEDYALSDPPRLVWIGSHSTETHITLISKVLRGLNDLCGARLVIVGSVVRSLGDMERIIDRVPWSLAHQAGIATLGDVGIMPLPDTAFTRGKCAYKLLQYGAAALPAVASPVGANIGICARAGIPAPTTDDDWADALRLVIGATAAERKRIGDALRAEVVSRYTFAVWARAFRESVALA